MFLFSTVLFISCEQDDVVVVEEEKHTPAVFTTKMIHSKESLPHIIKDVLSKTKQSMGIADLRKSTYDSINGFWIDDSRSFYLNSGEYDSYTFPIIHNDSTKLKNLLFSKEKNGTYTSFIVTYDLNYISLNDIHSGISTSLLQHITYDSVTSDFQFKDASFSVVGSGDCISEIKIDGRPCNECGTPYGETGCNLEPGDPRRAIGDRVLIIREECEKASGGTGIITEPVDDPNDDPNNGNTNDPNDPYISGSGTSNGDNNSNNNANEPDVVDDNTDEQDECLKLSNNDCASVITSPIDPRLFIKPVKQETQDFFDSLELTDIDLYRFINQDDQDDLVAEVDEYLEDENHNHEAKELVKDFLKIKIIEENVKLIRYIELISLLEVDPIALLRDCALQNGVNTQIYEDLYNHVLPITCSDRLNNLGRGFENQPISDGNVPLANMDNYSVTILTNPDLNNNGIPDSDSEVYDAFKNKFLNVASGEKEDFAFQCEALGQIPLTTDIYWDFTPMTLNDLTMFNTQQPISAIFLIDGGASNILLNSTADDGAIIVSGYDQNSWTVSTITTPQTSTQPFSGNREWGIETNQNGLTSLYTRAVDVARIDEVISYGNDADNCAQTDYYNIADATWRNMQSEIEQWIQENNGVSRTQNPIALKVDSAKILAVLKGDTIVDGINCN